MPSLIGAIPLHILQLAISYYTDPFARPPSVIRPSLAYLWNLVAAYAATISHTVLYNRREIVIGFKNIFRRKSAQDVTKYDVHRRLMSAYREVPEWHYLL